jgi:hypothetical protein
MSSVPSRGSVGSSLQSQTSLWNDDPTLPRDGTDWIIGLTEKIRKTNGEFFQDFALHFQPGWQRMVKDDFVGRGGKMKSQIILWLKSDGARLKNELWTTSVEERKSYTS